MTDRHTCEWLLSNANYMGNKTDTKRPAKLKPKALARCRGGARDFEIAAATRELPLRSAGRRGFASHRLKLMTGQQRGRQHLAHGSKHRVDVVVVCRP